jgi:hypothetical protein
MIYSVILLGVLSIVAKVSTQEAYYCADVGVTVGGSVPSTSQGYFSMKIGEGYSKYEFSVDLSGTDVCDFTTYPNVAYHIHTYAVDNPALVPESACGNTAGHYDPTLACSEKSQAHGTSCTDLGRTSALGYTYTCAAAAGTVTYAAPTGQCEVGDLSGKLGKVAITADGIVASSQVYTDYQPPFTYNFNTPTVNVTAGWASIVFHCGDAGGTRIGCGTFTLLDSSTESTICNFDSDVWVNNESCPYVEDGDDDGMKVSKPAYGAIIAFLVIGWVAAIGLGMWYCVLAGAKGSGEKAAMMNSSA